jgi:uncharacterized protein YukE
MTGKPPDFEPLAGSDPVPGDPGQIGALARRYGQTAYEIEQQAGSLRALSEGARAGWKGASGTVFASKAEDLATRILLARDRYEAAATALSRPAAPMADAQSRAYAAVWRAKDAADRMDANAPSLVSDPSGPGNSMARATAARYGEAESDLSVARGQFQDAVEDYNAAVNAAANAITSELSSDPMTDSWWDANFGWISHLFEVIAVVIIILVVVALILAFPLGGALLAALIGTELAAAATAYMGVLIIALTLLQTVFDGVAMVTDKESWTAFAWDIFSLAMCGTGKAAEVSLKFLAENAEQVGKDIAAVRAGKQVFRSRGLPGFLYSIAVRSGIMAKAVDFFKGDDLITAARGAAGEASRGVETAVKEASPSIRATLFTMNGDISQDLGKLGAIEAKVPDVWRITAARRVAQSVAGVDGALQWGAFGGSAGFTLHALLSPG